MNFFLMSQHHMSITFFNEYYLFHKNPPSSNGLGFMMSWRLGGKGALANFISDTAVYRTALATPGLLTNLWKFTFVCLFWKIYLQNVLFFMFLTLKKISSVIGTSRHRQLKWTQYIWPFFGPLINPWSLNKTRNLDPERNSFEIGGKHWILHNRH